MRYVRLLLALTSLFPATAFAAERIHVPAEPGFIVGFQQRNADQAIEERVPKGETVQNWTRMLTIQHFPGLVQRGRTGAGLLEFIAERILTACPGTRTSPIARGTVLGRANAQMATRCPRNPGTGKPETTFYRAISTPSDVHIVQVAFRSAPDAAAEKWAQAFLAKVVLCGTAPADALPVCKAR